MGKKWQAPMNLPFYCCRSMRTGGVQNQAEKNRKMPEKIEKCLLAGTGNKIYPEGPRIEKIQSRQAILTKSSFQYRMKFSIENGFFVPGPSLAAEKQGLGLKCSIENENFKPRMKISSENDNFVRGGMVFSCVRARMNFFDPRALWVFFQLNDSRESGHLSSRV